MQCVGNQKQPATGTRDYYNYFFIFQKKGTRRLNHWSKLNSRFGVKLKREILGLIPFDESRPASHCAIVKKKKKKKKGLFHFFIAHHKGVFFLVDFMDVNCWLKRLYIYIWMIISCSSRRMRYNPPVLSRFNLSTHVGERRKKKRTLKNKTKKESCFACKQKGNVHTKTHQLCVSNIL